MYIFYALFTLTYLCTVYAQLKCKMEIVSEREREVTLTMKNDTETHSFHLSVSKEDITN